MFPFGIQRGNSMTFSISQSRGVDWTAHAGCKLIKQNKNEQLLCCTRTVLGTNGAWTVRTTWVMSFGWPRCHFEMLLMILNGGFRLFSNRFLMRKLPRNYGSHAIRAGLETVDSSFMLCRKAKLHGIWMEAATWSVADWKLQLVAEDKGKVKEKLSHDGSDDDLSKQVPSATLIC